MYRHFVLLAAAFFLGGCAGDLTPIDQGDRGPAPSAPDATSHLPTPSTDRPGGTPRI